jgi:hypothetical protein
MATKDPTATAALWASRLGAAAPEITAGVQRVTTAPGTAAAAKVDTWLAKIQASRDKWVRNVSSITLSEWQTAMINKGVPRVSSGAQAAQPKMVKFYTAFLPYVEQGAATVRNMPNATLQDGIARAVAQINYNAAFPGYR